MYLRENGGPSSILFCCNVLERLTGQRTYTNLRVTLYTFITDWNSFAVSSINSLSIYCVIKCRKDSNAPAGNRRYFFKFSDQKWKELKYKTFRALRLTWYESQIFLIHVMKVIFDYKSRLMIENINLQCSSSLVITPCFIYYGWFSKTFNRSIYFVS